MCNRGRNCAARSSVRGLTLTECNYNRIIIIPPTAQAVDLKYPEGQRQVVVPAIKVYSNHTEIIHKLMFSRDMRLPAQRCVVRGGV